MTLTVNAVPDTPRVTAVSALQSLLPRLVALSLHAKQAHWNVTGPGFLPLHELTDRLAADARGWADRVAERAVALGFSVDARPGTVSTVAGPFPAGRLTDREVVTELASLVEGVAMSARSLLADLEANDVVGHDITVDILEGLDLYHWLLEAQTL